MGLSPLQTWSSDNEQDSVFAMTDNNHARYPRLVSLWVSIFVALPLFAGVTAKSPNGRIALKQQGSQLVVYYQQRPVLTISDVGVVMTEANASLPTAERQAGAPVGMGQGGVTSLEGPSKARRIDIDYTMLAGKRLHCTNQCNEYRYTLRLPSGQEQVLVMRLANDGIAFRYELENLHESRLGAEHTTFRIPDGTPRWMQTWTDSYEGFFPLATDGRPARVGRGRQLSNRWGYPALLDLSDYQHGTATYALITESNIEDRQSASCLYNDGEFYRVVPDGNDVVISGSWHTPWRVVIMGSLADIVESTLVTDMAEPSKVNDISWIKPGVVSWVYWAYNHGSNDYDIIKKYVDLAVALHLPYVLIDAEWDEMKAGKTIEDAVAYARQQGVKPMIWYNSSVGWIDGAPGPKFRLNKPEDREREFAWCEQIGVAGVKIDFFSGDNQMNMQYCQDLLECGARHHLLVNFHGATIPRGWQRTWPNLMSTEGVYGAEWYNNVPTFTRKAAAHNCMLPFTRNVIGPMDYTPCAFSDSQHPHITTHAHELALTVVFESALQHLADRPESFLAQPMEVQQFLGQLPTAWDETRLLGGYPGQYVVMARRCGDVWYVGILNGRDELQTIRTDALKSLKAKKTCNITCFADSGESTGPWDISHSDKLPLSVTLPARGGAVFVIDNSN